MSKLIEDAGLPLVLAGSHTGFQRDDGRSWIGFHDGVNNIEPSQRLDAVECGGEPDWNRGGLSAGLDRANPGGPAPAPGRRAPAGPRRGLAPARLVLQPRPKRPTRWSRRPTSTASTRRGWRAAPRRESASSARATSTSSASGRTAPGSASGLEGWLGDVNFGGPTAPGPGEPQQPELMSLRAGGYYAVPPREDPFPGAARWAASMQPRLPANCS